MVCTPKVTMTMRDLDRLKKIQAVIDGDLKPGRAAERLGLTEALIGGIDDRRQSGKIQHAIGDLVRQRLYAIACDYPDGNDAGRLGADPIHKLLCGRDPLQGENLASQPTLSRCAANLARDRIRMSCKASADRCLTASPATSCPCTALRTIPYAADSLATSQPGNTSTAG